MLQMFLEDRFRLRLHREAKEVPIYALRLSRKGAKLERSKEGSCLPVDVNHLPSSCAGATSADQLRPTVPTMKGRNLTIDARGITMKDLAGVPLSRNLDRPVQDKTGLAGMFDFHLEFTPDEGISPPGSARRQR